jgi:hypothetical protein
MIIVPVPFSIEGGHMLQHTKWLLEETEEDGSSLIAIHPSFEKLLTSLRCLAIQKFLYYNPILQRYLKAAGDSRVPQMEDNEFEPSYGWLHSDLLMYLSLDSDLLIYQFSHEG